METMDNLIQMITLN